MADDLWDEEADAVAISYSSNQNTYSNSRQNYSSQRNEQRNWRSDGSDSRQNDSYQRSEQRNWRSNNSDSRQNDSYQRSEQRNWRSDRGGGEQDSSSSRSYKQNDSYRDDSRRSYGSSEESCDMMIDNSFVGKVIGRGGAKIKELQSESGAYIKVMRNDTGAADTCVKISGTSDARDKAKELIEDLICGVSNMSTKSNQSYEKNYGSSQYQSNDEPFDWAALLKQSDEAKLKKLAALPPIIKDFYHEDPKVASMSQEEVKKFRKENNSISVMKIDPDDDRKVPNPVTSFRHAFHPYPELLEELDKQGFSTPSPIQCQAWPILLKGYDLIGIAQTGTGKTIAFLFPALIHLVGQVTPREQRVGPSVLVLAPTRELAQQIEQEAKKYTYRGITSICIYGGGSRKNQINSVQKGVDIVIATPGRLNDLCMAGVIDVSGVTYLVLDEADRMLDMGFEPQIRKIVLDIREDRQTVMTSATWTAEIQELAARYMIKPMKVNVGAFDLAAVHSVTQEIIFGEDDYDERRKLLDEFIQNMGPDDKAIVFVEKKAIADDISSDLNLKGIEVQSIHGDREQCDREQALDDLKTGYVKILIATDVASRGIDIKDITLIFNLFFPRNIEEYVHRVGRTGRAGRTGKAISVVTRRDWNHAAELIKILEEANQYVPDELYTMAERYHAWKQKKIAEDRAAGGGRRGRGGGRNRY